MKFNGMMASDSNMFPAWFLIFALFSIYVVVAHSQTEGGVRLYEGKRLIRIRRGVCVDGTYEHGNRSCCLCAAGQRVTKHCSKSLDDGTCEPCQENMYNSHPNSQTDCELCTECTSFNANLEVHEPCGPATNTKCRCKKDHFCSSGTGEPCKICFPCKVCGADGIKAPCTATSDTECNEKSEGGNTLYIVLGILTIVIIAAVVFSVCWIKRKRMRQQNITQQPHGNEDMSLLTVQRMDLSPYVPEIAEVIGWTDLEAVAMRVGIPNTTIDACKLDNPGQSQQQTQQLLKTLAEHQGMEASGKLIQILQNSGKRGKAERVVTILTGGTHVSK